MTKLLSIVRFISSQLHNLVSKLTTHSDNNSDNIRPALILGPVLFFLTIPFSASASPLKMALIDTGFCPVKTSKAKIHAVIDLTESVKLDCKKVDLKSPRFHGQHVLMEFLKFIDGKKNSVEVFPLIVFDAKGDQKKEYWNKAIDWVKEKKIDVVLTAAGFITNSDELKTLPADLPGIWFIPSGRLSPGVKETTILYPQELAPKENLFLIGDYYDGKMILYDQGLLYKNKIDYFFPSGKGSFTGTSRAVAEAMARALNHCSVLKMRECLSRLSKDYVDGISQRKVKTY